MTQTVSGPSLFCAGFAAQFVNDEEIAKPGGKVKTVRPKNPKNPKKAQDSDPTERRR